ncbi:hypothetical protein R6Q57_006195 [Mikania cordata]
MSQQMQTLWKDNHNLALPLSRPPESQRLLASAIHVFNTGKISHALRMNPVINENLIEEFWLSAKIHKEGDGRKGTITARVQDMEIVITETIIRKVMCFTDKSTDPRYVDHVFMVSMSGKKRTFDMLNKDKTSAFVALSMNWGFNFSKFILNEMKGNLRGSRSERFMMYPKFLQMIFYERFPNLQRGVVTRDLRLLSEATFPLTTQNRGGVDVGEVAEIINVMIEEKHDVQVLGSRSSDVDVYMVLPPEYEDIMTGQKPDMDFHFESEMEPVEIKSPEQMNLLTAQNLEALLEHFKRSVGNPPPTSSFTDQEPPLDTAVNLILRKRRRRRRRRRRDPRPGIVVSEPETNIISLTQVPPITVEPREHVPHFTESTAGPSSSHIEDVDYDSLFIGETETKADKGKNVLPDDEPIDVVKL